MTYRMLTTSLLPALMLALGLAFIQTPAQADQTAMEMGADNQTTDESVHKPHRWGD